ncbi:efflux RND transporter permease subunit [Escherichia coli]
MIALTTTPTASAKSSVPQDDITNLCADCCRNGGVVLRLPSSFLPEEDQGVFLTMIQLPAGATQERTQKVWIK